MKDFSLLGRDCKTEVITGFSEQVHATLQIGLCTSVQCTVVGKEEITGCIFVHFGPCLQPSRIEELSVCTIRKADTDVTVTEGIGQHGGERHAK